MSARKKIIYCTYASIYSSKILEQLLADSDIELVAIVNSTRVLRPSLNPIKGSITQLRNSGLRYSSYLFFVTGFFKWIQPFLILRRWPLKHVHALAKLNNIPIIDTRDINSTEVVDFIKHKSSNYLLCAHFNQLIKEPILTIENLQCINIHPSLLPDYKGVDPVFFAMQDNANKIGVSLHRMDSNFDSGDILLQSSIPMDSSKSLLFNNCQLFEEGMRLALNWIKNNDEKKQTSIKNNTVTEENYDSWPTKNDVKSFKKSGKRLMRLSGLWNQQ